MSRYQFTAAQRYAIFTVHGERCYLNGCLINLKTMQVDHIIPESLQDHPDQLGEVLRVLGRPKDFNLNSYENWLPACGPCNNRKRSRIFSPSPLIQIELDRAQEKASRVGRLAEKAVRDRDVATALNTLERAAEREDLDDEALAQLAALIPFHRENRAEEAKGEPIRLTPLYEVLSEDGFRKVVRGPYGIGARPVGSHIDASWNCPTCGSIGAWSGARCVICGEMSDD